VTPSTDPGEPGWSGDVFGAHDDDNRVVPFEPVADRRVSAVRHATCASC